MKSSALVLGAVLSLSFGHAFAYPAVGDEAKYAGTSKKGTESEKAVTLNAKVINWDATDKEWDVEFTMNVDGTTTTKVEDIDEAKMWSPTMWAKVQSECTAKGGVLEDVTVVAGTFATCHVTKTWGTKTVEMWWGDVPFGIVKMNKTNTDPVKMSEQKGELQSYTAMVPVPQPSPAP